jgi:hypothetical protein
MKNKPKYALEINQECITNKPRVYLEMAPKSARGGKIGTRAL